ncbi:MCE-family protein Mce4A [Mycolicibacterium insubricum]|jgi:phospholipid/cholesterol/gamma-HCH transport system substrate-binding protein|nr:MCE family protein [Mycolicibacterium insubricum]BBZ68858.1 MCE-family protein Mce4A [Mycolicibacterium insubricum]
MAGHAHRKRGAMPHIVAVRLAGAVLAAILVAAIGITYLSYTEAFSRTDAVTVLSPRAGLVMETDAKVKYRGIQIGKVKDIEYDGEQARLRLAIDSAQLAHVPANAGVQIAGNTIFGAKSVEFIAPDVAVGGAMAPGTTVRASAVQLEVNTLFQTLNDLLLKLDPVQLNGTVTALAEGLRGNGDNLGATLAGLNSYLGKLNPKLPTLEDDVVKAATLTNIYGDAAPDLSTVFDNVPTISATIVSQQRNLNRTLLAATGLANNAHDTLAPAAADYIAAMQRSRALTKVLGDYSPEVGCILKGTAMAVDRFAPIIGGIRPGLFVSSSFIPGVPAYTYPESLPLVNASGGPNCRGLPNIPSKQFGGSWWRAPFLVTDNAYVPFQPNTEVQVDAPSTLQFLFNGAFAERDRY